MRKYTYQTYESYKISVNNGMIIINYLKGFKYNIL